MASMKSGSKKRTERNVVQAPPTSLYPLMPGYPVFMPPWGPVPPWGPGNFQYQWNPPWVNPQSMNQLPSGYRPSWCHEDIGASQMTPHFKGGRTPVQNQEYLLNSLRHIYSNDGSIEIERVKFQKVPSDTVCYTTKSRPSSKIIPVEDSEAVYSSINVTDDGTVPPPRRRKKKQQVVAQNMSPVSSGESSHSPPPSPPWMPPYAPYMPYPYPYPFAFGYPCPPMAPFPHPPPQFTPSPDFIQSPSPSDGSENPSSKEDWKESPVDKITGEERDSQVKNSKMKEMRRTQEEGEEIGTDDQNTKEECQASSPLNNIPKKTKSHTILTSERRTRSLDESDLISEESFNTKESRELVEAFKNLAETAGTFEDHARIQEVRDPISPDLNASTSEDVQEAHPDDFSKRAESLLSIDRSIETVDSELIENEISDATLKDADSSSSGSVNEEWPSTAEDDSDSSYQWIIKSDEDDINQEEVDNDQMIQQWRTEVSLWRARLIVSLCKGQSFDQQDWETFQLLVQHPLAISMKLSLLNEGRLCTSNSGVGVACLRNGLLHFIPYGEALLKAESERASSWNTVPLDDSHFWTTIKGSQEIMKVFGYRNHDDCLRYNEQCAAESSIVARMTLDMLVLAEEFRYYLAGSHLMPVNITRLFTQKFIPPNLDQKDLETNSKKESESSNVPPVTDSSTSDSTTLPTVIQKHIAVKQETESGDETKRNQHIDADEPSIIQEEESVSKDVQSSSISSSIPDLHSLSTGLPSLVTDSDLGEKSTKLDSLENKENELSNQSNQERPRRRTKIVSKDNPEEHIYEEICELKSAAKSSHRKSTEIPPLPPKVSKIEDQSFIDTSISDSQPTKVARKKKRRAPMPPDFNTLNAEKAKDIEMIPTTEDISENISIVKQITTESGGNPFSEKPTPKGYVGKNPFYEDIEVPQLSAKNPPSYSSVNKGTNTKHNTDDSHPKKEELSKKTVLQTPARSQLYLVKYNEKNVEEELQCDSRVVAPINPPTTESSITKTETPHIEQKIIIKESCKKIFSPPPIAVTITEATPKFESQGQNYPKSDENEKPNISAQSDQKHTIECLISQNQEQSNAKESQQGHYLVKPKEDADQHCHKIEELQKALGQTKVVSSKSNCNKIYSPRIRSSGINKKEDASVIKIQTAKSDYADFAPIIPPMPPQKAPLKLFEDIPYIDTNELQQLKQSLRSKKPRKDSCQPLERSPSPPPYSPPQIPGNSPPETPGTSPPASPVFFLRRSSGTTVNIMEDSTKNQEVNSSQVKEDVQIENKNKVCENSDTSKQERTISIFEERYEIPDLTRVESNIKLLKSKNYLIPVVQNTSTKNQVGNDHPDRPKRKARPVHPPPRPPKPQDPTTSVPPLPPKLTDFCNSLWHSSSTLERSSTKSDREQNSSTLGGYNKSSPLLSHKSHTLPTKSTSREFSDHKPRSLGSPQRSLSTPSSPKPPDRSHSPSKQPKGGRSWSSVFCDCVYANEANGKRAYK